MLSYEIISAIVTLTAAVLAFMIRLLKTGKLKKLAEHMLRITDVIAQLIKDAEKFTNYSGAEKKAFVLTNTSLYALHNKLKYNEETVSAKIEELVSFSKAVNAKTESSSDVKV